MHNSEGVGAKGVTIHLYMFDYALYAWISVAGFFVFCRKITLGATFTDWVQMYRCAKGRIIALCKSKFLSFLRSQLEMPGGAPTNHAQSAEGTGAHG